MFSGIIEQLGRIETAVPDGGSLKLAIRTGFTDLALGESVAVNGVCLTALEPDPAGLATFFVSAETLDRSNLAHARAHGTVNLERSVTPATRLSGHLVQGHVDGKARIEAMTEESGAWGLHLSLPAALHRYCVEKGSIALNGISLTLNQVGDPAPDGRFAIHLTIIPHTWTHTNLQHYAPGDEINVEVDMFAKYVERQCQPYRSP